MFVCIVSIVNLIMIFIYIEVLERFWRIIKILKNFFDYIFDIVIVVIDLWFWVSKNWGVRWIYLYDIRGCDLVLLCFRDFYGG